MPELPEVETMRRGVAVIAGSRIVRVWRPRVRLRPIQITPELARINRRVAGRHIDRVARLGKRILLELDSLDRVVIEPRMTGRLLLANPPNRSHLRLVFELEEGPSPELLFWDVRGLGVVRLLAPEQFADQLGADRLGPDALEISAAELRRRLAASRRPVKVALMDQRVLVGIGNLYASEIVHRAGIHPASPCNALGGTHWERLHAEIRAVLEEAILLQGSTLADGTYRNVQGESGGFQERHRVYQRSGRPCGTCGVPIVRIVQGQRSTFFCPSCQRKRFQTAVQGL